MAFRDQEILALQQEIKDLRIVIRERAKLQDAVIKKIQKECDHYKGIAEVAERRLGPTGYKILLEYYEMKAFTKGVKNECR